MLVAALALCGLGGCVERTMTIITDPPTATVLDEKHQPLGSSPVDRTFTYYGKYRFYIVKDGYETLIVEEKVRPPWYEYFPLDFIAENVIPFNLRDKRYFRYTLQPSTIVPPKDVLDHAQVLRERGRSIGVPLPGNPQSGPAPLQGVELQPPLPQGPPPQEMPPVANPPPLPPVSVPQPVPVPQASVPTPQGGWQPVRPMPGP
jgi:hypothetical protein